MAYKNLNKIGLNDDQTEEICNSLSRTFSKKVVINDHNHEVWIRKVQDDPAHRGFILRVSATGSVRLLLNCATPGERLELRKGFEGTVRDIVDQCKEVYSVESPRDTGKQDAGNVYTFKLLQVNAHSLYDLREAVAVDALRLHDWFANAGYYKVKV